MKNVGEYVIYRKDVCKVVEVKKNHFNDRDYYLLVPVNDPSLKVDVPVDNPSNCLRDLITKEEVEKIIRRIPQIDVIECNKKDYIDDGYFSMYIYFRNEVNYDS